ncbi:UNVERIFIED_CONTAM: hypothetical protein FKN15_036877 [Acipenser sinensis]
MGRKSCRKQQKWQQQQQLPPGDVGPIYVVDEWCPGCGKFGHTVAICPTQYQGEEWAAQASQDQVLRGRPQKREIPAAATKRESSWDDILQVVMHDCWCPICGEQGHSPLNCPLLSEGCLLHPFPPSEGECLLVPPPPPTAEKVDLLCPLPPAEGESLLVPSPPPPTTGAEQHHRHQQRERACWSHLHHLQRQEQSSRSCLKTLKIASIC